MSLNPNRNFSLRLTFWYALISLIAYIAIFGFAYYSFYKTFKNEDKRAVTSLFQKYLAYYKEGDISGLQEQIESERSGDKPFNVLIRISDGNNQTLLISLPDEWHVGEISSISNLNITSQPQKIGYRESVFEIHTFKLIDGNFFQIGKDISQREGLLNRFRQISIVISMPAIAMSFLVGYLLTFRALSPIRHLTKTVTSILNTADITARVPSNKSSDEIGNLVILFNAMLDRIETLVNAMKESLDVVAHDLRTPMTRLRGIAEDALSSEGDMDRCREALSDCLEESERLLKMLNTLMDISEAQAGTLNLKKERIDMSELLRQTVEVYQYVAEQRDITINLSVDTHDCFITVDSNRMHQVVGNLLDNAIKYTHNGGLVNVRMYKNPKNEVVIEVSDNGIGINEADISRIWHRLYRAGQNQTRQGMGLGLSLVKSIVELHGGRVEVRSRLDVGSTFSVYLPLN